MAWKVVKELMPILAAKTSNKQRGFSLIEILVAMSLMAAVFTLIPFDGDTTERKNLDESIGLLDRAVRFSVNEAILRNVIVRIKFKLATQPVEYSIEYGNAASIVLPETIDESRLSLSERELYDKQQDKFNSQFTPIQEFTDGLQTLPEYVELYAVASSYYPDLITSGEPAIYFYPTGERDNALLILNTAYEYATYSIAPFEDKTFSDRVDFAEEDLDNLSYVLEQKASEEYEQWLKE